MWFRQKNDGDIPVPLKMSLSMEKESLSSNPDPKVFQVRGHEVIGNYLIVVVRYPNCTNFGGKKILVYENLHDIYMLLDQGELDPHFGEGDNFYPVARFQPTTIGLLMAREMCEHLSKFPEGVAYKGGLDLWETAQQMRGTHGLENC